MSFNGIYTIFQKDLKSVVQDKMILIIVVIPIVLSIVMPLMNVSANNMTASIVVYDEGNNSQFIDYLKSIDYYNVTSAGSADDLNKAVSSGDSVAGITIPAGFCDDIRKGVRPGLAIRLNPSITRSTVFTQTYRDVIFAYTGEQYPVNITIETTQEGGTSVMASAMILPMLILVSVILVGISILPYTLTTEKEKKTLDAILVSPASEKDVIYGKMLFGLCLTLAVSLLVLLLNGGLIGSVHVTLLFIVLGATSFVGIGLLVGSVSNNYNSASVISTVIMLPLMLLPIFASFSDDIATVARVLPSTYMYDGISDSMNGNGTVQGMLAGLLALAIFNVAIYALTIYVVRKKRNAA